MTRTALASLPAAELAHLADAALRAAAVRHGLPPVRAAGLPRWLHVEAVLSNARWGSFALGEKPLV